MSCSFFPWLFFGYLIIVTLCWPFLLSLDICVWLDCVICLEDVSGMWLVPALVLVEFFLEYFVIGFCARRCVEAFFKIFFAWEIQLCICWMDMSCVSSSFSMNH